MNMRASGAVRRGGALNDYSEQTEVSFIQMDPAAAAALTTPWAVDRARKEYRECARRQEVLGGRLSSGPAWNMLLDLFISSANSKRLSVSALCIGARTSSATALRYLSLLQEAGFVERTVDMTDARRSYVYLTDAGWSKMADLLN